MSERDRRPRSEADDDPAATEADVYEQERELLDVPDDDDRAPVPDGVDPADAREQQLAVDFDEDDYR